MLRKQVLLDTFVKNIRNKMLLKQVARKSATKNNSIEMLLKKQPLQTFVKNIHSKILPETLVDKKVSLKTIVPKCGPETVDRIVC